MSERKLKAAIIGCGMIAYSAHIPAYKYFSDKYELVAICDVFEKAAREAAEKYDIPSYFTNAEEMLCSIKPDVVSICVPNMLHKQFVLLCLEHDANVICEKPLAFTLHDAKEMYALAKSKGLSLMACQSMRFTPDRIAAKKLLDNGEIGTPYYGEFSRIRRRGIPTWGTFHIKERSGGGAFIDIGVHMVDAVLWLMGNPEIYSVNGSTCRKLHKEIGTLQSSGALTGSVQNARKFDPDEMNVEDFSCGTITFKNGARINFKVAWAANLRDETTIRIIGEKSGVELPDGIIHRGIDDDSALEMMPEKYECGSPFSGHFHVVEDIYDVVVNGKEPIIKPEETINVAGIIEAFYRSAELGREVAFEELL
ncbi:MAG: Gfo/Idh/MocA family oxidoreductase [Clostridia bacterium]|nr:Gfo/Idh/MocA family oxidoreductase [Clostridia bacterium]